MDGLLKRAAPGAAGRAARALPAGAGRSSSTTCRSSRSTTRPCFTAYRREVARRRDRPHRRREVRQSMETAMTPRRLDARRALVGPRRRRQPRFPRSPQELFAQLHARVQAVEQRLDGVLGVYVEDLTAGRRSSCCADEPFPHGLVDQARGALRALPPGRRGPARRRRGHATARCRASAAAACCRSSPTGVSLTWRDLAVLMMRWSDNEATNLLIRRVGMRRRQPPARRLASARRACAAR